MSTFLFILITFSQAQTNAESRLAALEQSVKSLEEKIRKLESTALQNKSSLATPGYFTCYVETPFNGTFSATEVTEDGARFAAMEKCSKSLNEGNFACGKRKVKCSGGNKK